jgi:hypothetical protein
VWYTVLNKEKREDAMTIALTPDIVRALSERAQQQGTTVEIVALDVLREKLALPNSKDSADLEQDEERKSQIAALAMKGTTAPRPKDSWRKTVGKYPEDSPLNRMLDKGAALREAERGESC